MRNVVLDWSGTLVDDLEAVLYATNAVFRKYQVQELTLHQFRAEFELPLSKFYPRFLPGIPFTEIDDCYQRYFVSCRETVSLLPGVREFLEFSSAAGLQLFVLSTIKPDHFDAQATRLAIKQFFAKTYLGVTDKKETILLLLEENRLRPAETLLVGDTVHDMEAARHAGVMSIAVCNGFDSLEKLARSDPDAVVRDLVSLRKMIGATQNSLSEEWIEIADLQVQSKIGVPDEERLTFQGLLVSLRFQIRRGFEELKDQFVTTVDYAAVAVETQRIAQHGESQLLETLASEIANGLMKRFPIRRLEVELKKFILPDVRYVSAKTTRRR
jgi:dihydroneopterin aldolase